MAQTRAKRKASSYNPENVTCSGKTCVELDRISYLWTVEHYSVLANDFEDFVSPFKKYDLSYGEPKIVSVEDLVSTHMGLVVDDSFTILCEIWIHGEKKERVGNGGASRSGPSEEERTKIWEASLVNDFGQLYKESIGSDVMVKTKRTSFKAHKCVLMVRSPVFAAMFNAKMKEEKENCVKITDFDDKVVEGMLEHLYTGKTDCVAGQAEDLLKISEKYDLPSLKKDCEFVITDRLSKKNAAVTLILAHSHNAPYLKQKAADFINKNKKELLKSKAFVDAVKALAGVDVDLLAELYLSQ